MDSSLKSTQLAKDEVNIPLDTQHEVDEGAHEEPHIHLPNPSLWPALLSGAILLTVMGLLFIPDAPWLLIAGAILTLVSAVAWALEDPMAAPKAHTVTLPNPYRTKFEIGQAVLSQDGQPFGIIQARFKHYVLVEESDLFSQPWYVPHALLEERSHGELRLTASMAQLLAKGLNTMPADLYDDTEEVHTVEMNGVPMFARGPLSPAETGHYNYGPNSPGINTDASGSYRRDEVVPSPARYVGRRSKVYANSKSVPPRPASFS